MVNIVKTCVCWVATEMRWEQLSHVPCLHEHMDTDTDSGAGHMCTGVHQQWTDWWWSSPDSLDTQTDLHHWPLTQYLLNQSMMAGVLVFVTTRSLSHTGWGIAAYYSYCFAGLMEDNLWMGWKKYWLGRLMMMVASSIISCLPSGVVLI